MSLYGVNICTENFQKCCRKQGICAKLHLYILFDKMQSTYKAPPEHTSGKQPSWEKKEIVRVAGSSNLIFLGCTF